MCSHWLHPQMAKRSWEGEYNLLLCLKAVTDRAESRAEVSFRNVNSSSSSCSDSCLLKVEVEYTFSSYSQCYEYFNFEDEYLM